MPERWRRSCPPPFSSGAGAKSGLRTIAAPTPFGPAELVRRKEQHVRFLKLAKRQAANGLHRVADQYRAFRMHDFRNFRSRLDDTRLVIRSLHGGNRTGRKRSLKRIQIDGAIFQHRNCLELAGLEAMAGKNAWMLDGGNRQRLAPARLQKPIRRLGPAAR